MPKISRRAALARGGRAFTAAAAFPVIASVAASSAEGDVELLGAIERLKRLMGEYMKARDAADAAFEKAEADPDKPPFLPDRIALLDAKGVKYDVAQVCQESYAAVMKHRARFGWREPFDRQCDLGEQGRKTAERIFALPARTLKGALGKLQLANWLRSILDDPDDWVEAGEWEVASQRDFERLLGRA